MLLVLVYNQNFFYCREDHPVLVFYLFQNFFKEMDKFG